MHVVSPYHSSDVNCGHGVEYHVRTGSKGRTSDTTSPTATLLVPRTQQTMHAGQQRTERTRVHAAHQQRSLPARAERPAQVSTYSIHRPMVARDHVHFHLLWSSCRLARESTCALLGCCNPRMHTSRMWFRYMHEAELQPRVAGDVHCLHRAMNGTRRCTQPRAASRNTPLHLRTTTSTRRIYVAPVTAPVDTLEPTQRQRTGRVYMHIPLSNGRRM